jgi:N-acetylneuraminic acid mutarotase
VGGVAAVVLVVLALALGWQERAPLPSARSEVAAASFRGGVAVVGGFLADGSSSREVDLYSPQGDSWQRLPDLPVPVNHAMAAATGGRLYVLGGYGGPLVGARRTAFVLEGKAWTRLPPLPAIRAAGGAAIVGGRLYVVGGVGAAGLARKAFVLDLASRRWSAISGPRPREHLAVAAAGGRVYALAGRTAGLDTNLSVFEVYSTSTKRWRRLSPVSAPRGGTGAAAVGRLIVSAGGEQPGGTIASVYGYDLASGRWRRLPDLPTPRHGLGVASAGGRIYAVAGGTTPGLSASSVNEALAIP